MDRFSGSWELPVLLIGFYLPGI